VSGILPLRQLYEQHPPQMAASVQQFDRSGLRPFLTVADLHSHTLTLRQLTQSAPIEGRGMNEDVLATTILRYETEPLFDVVPLTEPRHSSVAPAPGRCEEGRGEGRPALLIT